MNYFSKERSFYSPKNKLQRKFYQQRQALNQVLVDSPKTFKCTLEGLLKKLNEETPNCTPLRVIGYDLSDGDYGYYIQSETGGDFGSYALYKVKSILNQSEP